MLVRAKRAGWDQRDGQTSETDDFDPPAWVDAGESEWVEGELEVTTLPETEMYRERKVYRVNGQPVDGETIEPVAQESRTFPPGITVVHYPPAGPSPGVDLMG